MTQEEKELLLKDLEARLSYGVKCTTKSTWNGIYTIVGYKDNRFFLDCPIYDKGDDEWMIESIVPYLRPMSSMTEEEWKELNCIGYIVPLYDGCFGVDIRAYCKNGQPHYRRFSEFSTIEDWLNAHYFDYHGLIPKGLAIAVTEENNPYKE